VKFSLKKRGNLFLFLLKNKNKQINIGYDITIWGINNIEIGFNVYLNDRVWLEVIKKYNHIYYKNALIRIGNNVNIGRNSVITSINYISIGDNCLFGPNVFITDHFHGASNHEQSHIPPILRDLYSKGKVIIEEGVWIGYGAVVMPNVIIGKFSVVGANSVVTKDIEPYSIVAGNPAKLIRYIKE
jgi:acetyltransferase-like isoleucine patch superfamily enzyme